MIDLKDLIAYQWMVEELEYDAYTDAPVRDSLFNIGNYRIHREMASVAVFERGQALLAYQISACGCSGRAATASAA
jgi:hypothetical protein